MNSFTVSSCHQAVDDFWSRHPAFLYGICSLGMFLYSVQGNLEALVAILLISLSSSPKRSRLGQRFLLIWMTAIFVSGYGATIYELPEPGLGGIEGTLFFEINSLTLGQTHFGKEWDYLGCGKKFYPTDTAGSGSYGKNFPCSIHLPLKQNMERPSADRSYLIPGTLKKSKLGHYFFITDRSLPWKPIKETYSLAEARYNIKQKVKTFIQQRLGDFRTAEFLSGMITGQFEDRMMRAEFGKLGLQHLMAISGFHFALLGGILLFFLRIVFPLKAALLLLIVLMTLYFLLLGSCPSIVRAWIMTVVGLTGLLGEKRGAALNMLGVSFLFVLLYDPLLASTLGFQFSAGVTASILLFYPAAKFLLGKLILVRPLETMKRMPYFDQHCYCVLSSFREGLALALAVNVTAVPMTFYYFHKFPLMSLIYNLFIPFLVSCSIFFVLVASVTYSIFPLVGTFLFKITQLFSHYMLNFIYDAPEYLNINWYVDSLPLYILMFYLGAAFLGAILFNARDRVIVIHP